MKIQCIAVLLCALAVGFISMAPAGESDVACNSSVGPDVVIGSLDGIGDYGCLDGICAYSIATNIVNIGDEDLPWFPMNNEHPAIAQHMYKMNEVRIEQIGISWVKHGFGALAWDEFDCDCQDPNDYDYLGVGCTDPYTTGLNGDQDGFGTFAGLGPRWEVNATNGYFPFPYTTLGQGGNAIYKRLQVHSDDLDPELNPNTVYFAEGHYVTPADALAGNGANSLGYRPMVVEGWAGDTWDLSLQGETVSGLPAIYAWAAAYPGVMLETIDIPDDGRMVLAAKATENPDGSWHYEYAWHNINSWRSGRSLRIDLADGAGITNPGWHAVDHHSGTPWANQSWEINVVSDGIEFSTTPADAGGTSSPICWGTMGNAWFDSDQPPGMTQVKLGYYRQGTAPDAVLSFLGPVGGSGCAGDANGDGVTDVNDVLAVLGVFGEGCQNCSEDLDGNGQVDVNDILALLADWDCES